MHGRPLRDAAAVSDRDQLLPGEDPDSPLASDITHWEAVHSELLATNHRILGSTLTSLGSERSIEARVELLGDRRRIQAELERFERRRRFWCGRDRRRRVRSR